MATQRSGRGRRGLKKPDGSRAAIWLLAESGIRSRQRSPRDETAAVLRINAREGLEPRPLGSSATMGWRDADISLVPHRCDVDLQRRRAKVAPRPVQRAAWTDQQA